ncbi:MAG: hypothetical protein K8J08_03180 [Thermoanaerobaculia bacterium]|nr:hypothetical protein [Thermoanaerobaculia bacterium]
MIEAMNAQMAELPGWVSLWLNWLMFIFLVSVFFVRRHRAARYALAAILLTLPIGLLVFKIHPNVHLLGVAHWLVWLPLLVYIVRKERGAHLFHPKTAYGVWISLLATTIVVSLLFDARDIALVALGYK